MLSYEFMQRYLPPENDAGGIISGSKMRSMEHAVG
jgi:hypothetical protein